MNFDNFSDSLNFYPVMQNHFCAQIHVIWYDHTVVTENNILIQSKIVYTVVHM